ncbi:hypothetical protein [Pseudaquabacterium rugosum]|uniref:Uncharacterized protein n=1 Tax=Pseudaquabacterium rugosum TaxID=2984194 RepID=A0ABU9B559_9BURK
MLLLAGIAAGWSARAVLADRDTTRTALATATADTARRDDQAEAQRLQRRTADTAATDLDTTRRQLDDVRRRLTARELARHADPDPTRAADRARADAAVCIDADGLRDIAEAVGAGGDLARDPGRAAGAVPDADGAR